VGTTTRYQDTIELAKGSHYTLLIDENIAVLKAGLQDEGYKVVTAPKGANDEEIKELASGGWTIVTRNSQDFLDDANHFDYDVIGIEDIWFIDDRPDRTNETVAKIAGALRRSELATRKGNFFLKVLDDGSFHLRQLV
jgi:hypothetical protein